MEWLETDGFGGFAMGSHNLIPLRQYHALLISATDSPAKRFALLNAVEATLTFKNKRYALNTFAFKDGTFQPEGTKYLKSFSARPFPSWTFEIAMGLSVTHTIFFKKETKAVFLSWELSAGLTDAKLEVRPFFTGRDYHALHKSNPNYNFKVRELGENYIFSPYPDIPEVLAQSNSTFKESPLWFYNVHYEIDKQRGINHVEDWASNGVFYFENAGEPAYISFSVLNDSGVPEINNYSEFFAIRQEEKNRRAKFESELELASDSYLVNRHSGKTIIAGYPWFADWGRDTFISIRGICLATGRLKEAEQILLEWCKTISEGMLPNRFLEYGESAEYNSVDASLWFIIAAYELIEISGNSLSPESKEALTVAIDNIIEHFVRGTRFNIKCDDKDCLLSAGQAGYQLTWMDAKVNGFVVTPRIGKPVEIQALWINALTIAGLLLNKYADKLKIAFKSFNEKFYNENTKSLFDVIDVDHISGKTDARIRPNQIFAIGGLPFQVLDPEKSLAVFNTVRNKLFTPSGLRTLDPADPDYCPRYDGDLLTRDKAYHQGTVWPWLSGSFIEAWLRINKYSPESKEYARKHFLEPLIGNMQTFGFGHLAEIYDAEYPHTPRGCPFQAWSVAETLRVQKLLNN